MNRAKSDVGDVVEEGHLRVGGAESRLIPALSSGGLPPKGERRMVPLRITGREVLIQRIHVHAGGGGGAVEEVSGGVGGANPRLQLTHPWYDMTP